MKNIYMFDLREDKSYDTTIQNYSKGFIRTPQKSSTFVQGC